MNINQPPPGIAPDPHSGEVTLVSTAVSDITGVHQHIDLYSDGSRKVYENGKLVEEQPTFSDEEKARGAMQPDFLAEPEAGAAADEPPLDEGDGLKSDLPPEAVAAIVTQAGASASGVLNDAPGAGQPVGEDGKVESWKKDEPLFAHTPPKASQSQLPADAILMEDADKTQADAQQEILAGEDDGPAPKEHNEARDKLEAVNEDTPEPPAKQAKKPAAKATAKKKA